MKILITGGHGMLGKSLVKALSPYHEVITPTSKELNLLASINEITDTISEYGDFDYVIHAAALVGGILDNVNRCFDYMYENTVMNMNIVRACNELKIPRLLGILSTCIYPDSPFELHERDLHAGLPHETNFGYAMSKRALAKAIDLSNQQYGTKYSYIIPSNLYGENDHRDERSHFVSIMCGKIVSEIKNKSGTIMFDGCSNPIRQYLYVDDLAEIIKRHIESDIQDSYNVAYPISQTLGDMVRSALRSIELDVNVFFKGNIGGQNRRVANLNKFHQYHPQFIFTPFKEGVRRVIQSWL